MILFNALRIALTELRRNLTRSALTSLGILIGVGAVIAMVGLGRGATASIEDDLASMGQNLLMLMPGADGGPQSRTATRALTLGDAEAIGTEVPYVRAAAPQVSSAVTAERAELDWDTSVTGTTEDYFEVVSWPITEGRIFSEAEALSGASVCVLGESVRQGLFGASSPLGASIRLGDSTCEVIGVLEARGQNTMGMDQDDTIIAPIRLVQRRMIGTDDVGVIFISIDRVGNMDAATSAIDGLMRRRRHVTSEATMNFRLRDTREITERITGVTQTMTAFLAAVAGVSLLVGGIGIMNIMLVSVTERTREIGVRMAIGALERDVMTQFLVEAVVLSAFGGILGIIVGILGTWAGSRALGVNFIIDWRAVMAAVVFSALIGIVFGWFPARRAARLEPIDALRST